MRFSAIFSVLATGAMAFAGAIPKRSATGVPGVQNALDDISGKAQGIIPQFSNCKDPQCLNDFVNKLVDVVTSCNATIPALSQCGTVDNQLALTASGMIDKIADGLETVKKNCGEECSGSSTTTSKLDPPLSACMAAACDKCPGLIPLLPPQPNGHLQDLGLPKTLQAVGPKA